MPTAVIAILACSTAATQAATASQTCPGVHVALDIGHTLSQPGATSARGATEFGFNQTLGGAVANSLAHAGIATTVINAKGTHIALADRTAEARRAGANLFLSLHHDSVQKRYLEEWQVDGRTLSYSDRFHGYSLFVSQTNAQPKASQQFATAIGEGLNAAGFTPSHHHAEMIPNENKPVLDASIGLFEYDNLIVLRTAAMPAVLLEAGVIVNRQEELRARDPATMDRMAEAIAGAIRRYCGR